MSQKHVPEYLEQLSLPTFGSDPQPSNRGVTKSRQPLIFSHLDYFSATYPYPQNMPDGEHPSLPIPDDWFTFRAVGYGVRNWRRSATMLPAGTFYWNPGEKEAGSYLVLAGDDWGLLRSRLHVNDWDILPRLMRNVSNVTRLDFAVNIDRGHPVQTRKHFTAGNVKTRVQTAHEHSNFAGAVGRTFYFGSDQSDRMLRCYDKAAELQLLHQVLTRIELQSRRSSAHSLAHAMLRQGVEKTGKQAIRGFIDFPKLGWWQQALRGEHVNLQIRPRADSSFSRWLTEQVGPAILKRAGDIEYRAFIDEWLASIAQDVAGIESDL